MIVQYVPGANQNGKDNALNGKGKKKGLLRRESGDDGELVLVKVLPEQASDRAKLKLTAASLERDDTVAFAEPNYKLKASQASTNDVYYSQLWGMLSTGSNAGAANVVAAWSQGYTNCSGVVIGVIDEVRSTPACSYST